MASGANETIFVTAEWLDLMRDEFVPAIGARQRGEPDRAVAKIGG
jgi:hypothetical protein